MPLRSKFFSFSKPNARLPPGAMSSAISAASIRKVPLPHIGSSSSFIGCPAGQPQNAGGQVLAQRRVARGRAVAALEQRFSGGVEVKRHLVGREERMDAHVGRARIHVRAFAAVRAKRIAHRVLQAQRHEVEAFQRAARRRDVDADGVARVEPLRPFERECCRDRCRLRCDRRRCRHATARGWRCGFRD